MVAATSTLPTYREVAERERAIAEAYGRLFDTPDGEVVLKDLEAILTTQRSIRPAEGAPVDPHMLSINEGRRQAFEWIKARITTANGGTHG